MSAEFRTSEETQETRQIKLRPITSVRAYLEYSVQNLDGAMEHPFLATPALIRLENAAQILSTMEEGKYQLLIWDAYRTRETQQAIFIRYLNQIKIGFPEYDDSTASARALEFVNPPDIVFPHGTGGAVDLTLMKDNKLANMGTNFDDFIPQSEADWYRENLPLTETDVEACKNRKLLREVMEQAGFVVLDSEWWHFEYGTRMWADKTGETTILDRVLSLPYIESPADDKRNVDLRQPSLETGVAQVFLRPADRADSLAHLKEGHYYGRSSQPTLEHLERHFLNTLEGKHAWFTESGLSAAVIAVKSCVPPKGTLLYDHLTYYEVERALMHLAKQLSWQLIKADFTQLSEDAFHQGESKRIDALFCDNPRNWWLDTLDIRTISHFAKIVGAKLIVDTSVQPLQPALKKGADLMVISLSKYPSIGLTLGGAIVGDNHKDINQVKSTATEEGHILPPEAAFTIWGQLTTMRDRMFALSHKTEKLASFLGEHPKVAKVRIPNPALLGGLIGGQLTFHLVNPEQGPKMEKVIGFNALSLRSSLSLACTFGASFTTFEHFSSNKRHRTGVPIKDTTEALITDDMVRLGIGYEKVEDIADDLDFLLDITS